MSTSLIPYKRMPYVGRCAVVGGNLIFTWKAAAPGDFSQHPMPMICIEPQGLDYQNAPADDPDLSSRKSFIWYRGPASKLAAERIALELANSGVGVAYPCDKGLFVQLAEQHQMVCIGEAKPVEREME